MQQLQKQVEELQGQCQHQATAASELKAQLREREGQLEERQRHAEAR